MAEREIFLVRLIQPYTTRLCEGADDQLHSVNAQVEFALRQAPAAADRLAPNACLSHVVAVQLIHGDSGSHASRVVTLKP